MRITKFFCLILAAVSLVTAFSGCHGSRWEREPFYVPEEFDTSRTYELSFWAKNDTNTDQVNAYHKAIADFEAIYPNIKVKMKPYTDYGRIYQDVITNISTGTTPNICITYPDHIATYNEGANMVVPLGSLMDDKKYGLGGSEVRFDAPTKDEMIPKFLEECKLDGDYYAMPFVRSTEACYINKTYVEKLGFTLPEVLTWDFVWEVSEAATKKDADGNFAVNGQKVMIPFIYKSTDNMMIQMLKQKGAGYSNDKGEVLIFNDSTEEILMTVAEHASTRAFSTFKISSYPANYLNAGQCIFAIDSTAGSTWMGAGSPMSDIHDTAQIDYEIAVMTIPQYDTENPKMISQGPSLCVFNKEDPQEVLASWLFVQYMLSNDAQISYATTEGYAPVTSKAQNSKEYKDYFERIGESEGEDNKKYYHVKLKATKLLMDNTENTFITPVFNGSTSLRNAAGQLIEEVAKTVRRKGKVDGEYIDELYKNMRITYHLDELDGKKGFGKMPAGSVILLIVLAITWIFIGAFAVFERKKRKIADRS